MSADQNDQSLAPISPQRLAEEIERLSAKRRNGELDATGFDQRFARMVGELRDRKISGSREEIQAALDSLRTSNTLRPEEWFRLEKQLNLT
jgi:hypothetical protein